MNIKNQGQNQDQGAGKEAINAAIYIRVSSDDDSKDKQSPAVQLDQCRAIAKQYGYNVVLIEEDNDISGRTYPTGHEDKADADSAFMDYFNQHIKNNNKKYRKGLGNIFANAAKLNIKYIICRNASRIMRPLDLSYLEVFMLNLIKSNNITIHSVEEGILDYSKLEVRLVQSIKHKTNNDAISKQLEASAKSIKKLKNDGYLVAGGSLPFGYISVKKQKVDINHDYMELIKYIFNAYSSGMLFSQILNEIDKMQANFVKKMIDAKRKDTALAALKRIIRNPVYCGKVKLDDGTMIDSKVMPAVISYDLWVKCQNINYVKVIPSKTDKSIWINPLQGLVYCGYCGHKLSVDSSRFRDGGYHRLASCRQSHYSKQTCSSKCRIELLDVTAKGRKFAGLISCLRPLGLLAYYQTDKIDNDTTINEYRLRLAAVVEKQTVIDAMFADGGMIAANYRAQSQTLANQHKELAKQIKDLEDANRKKQSVNNLIKLHASFEKLDNKQLRDVFINVIRRVDVYNWYIVVTLTDETIIKIPRLMYGASKYLPHTINIATSDKPTYQMYLCQDISSYTIKEQNRAKYIDRIIVDNDKLKIIGVSDFANRKNIIGEVG